MDLDTSNSNSNSGGTISQIVTSRLPGLSALGRTVDRNERRRVIRTLKNEERRQATKAVEVSQVLTRSMRLGRKPTKHADEVLFCSPIV